MKLKMNKLELLVPVGDFECLKAAVQNGADSVYFGANMFNARASAKNFNLDELKKAIEYCNLRNVKSHLTLNILIKNSEFKDAVFLAKKAYEYGIDSIIVQDFGLAQFLIKNFPYMKIHASTQMSVHNLEGAIELQNLGFKRVVLARELALNEIDYICKNCNIETEVFIHGALCISYSGQCLFSSLVGGRSANRGKCAGPCRLPYKLIKKPMLDNKETIIDSGYLLSTRDLCGLSYIPQLINSGVTSLKIEGRMKTPEYVAIVTKIYRKYIDMALLNNDYSIDENDVKELMQVFNRGGFSEGHFNEKENKNLIFPDKPNNMGLYLGNICNYNKAKGLITLDTHEKLTIGDTISVEKEDYTYTISELMIKNKNVVSALPNKTVTFGRMKGNISVGDKVYKLSDKLLTNAAKYSYENYENKKLMLNAVIIIKENEPIKLKVSTLSSNLNNKNAEPQNDANSLKTHSKESCKKINPVFDNIKVEVTSDIIPVKALSSPITSDRVIKQLSKTKNSPFEFKNIKVVLEDELYIPSIAVLNELRRCALDKVSEVIIKRCSFSLENDASNSANNGNIENNTIQIKNLIFNTTFKNKNFINKSKYKLKNKKKISLLLNDINLMFNYKELDFNNIDNTYIPINFFMHAKYKSIIEIFANNTNLFIYMPIILKTNYRNVLKNVIEEILKNYSIKGFVISNISGFQILKDYIGKYKFIGNYSLNVFNSTSIKEYSKLGINTITLSPELDKQNLINLSHVANVCQHINTELIVYGNMPLMHCNYCYLSKSNKCYPNCGIKCSLDNTYYLKDRLGMKFRIIPDKMQTITTIFNCKKLSISSKCFPVNALRVDILDENVEEINRVLSAVKLGNKLEGKNYTNGNLNREI